MRSIEDTYCPYDKPFGEKRGEIIDVQEIFECLKRFLSV
jgi:hypothetical protein